MIAKVKTYGATWTKVSIMLVNRLKTDFVKFHESIEMNHYMQIIIEYYYWVLS